MAFPIIKIDSNDGAASDSACSGAGPATALTGTCHNNNGADGAVLTVSGSLTGVVDTGAHAIYVETASGRRFARITNISGSQVTTANAFPAIPSGTPVNYAIGGVRASLAGTNSRLLMEQAASAAGDASAGWVIEMQSGHTETIATTVNVRVANSTTDGVLTIRGTGATKPVLTFTNTDEGFENFSGSPTFAYLELVNTNATKTSSVGILNSVALLLNEPIWLVDLEISNDTHYFASAIAAGSSSSTHMVGIGLHIANCTNDGIDLNGGSNPTCSISLYGCHVHDCGGHGVSLAAQTTTLNSCWYRCIFANNGDCGAYLNHSADSTTAGFGIQIVNCTFDNNTNAGLDMQRQRAATFCKVINCQFTNNGTYGCDLPSTATSANYVRLAGQLFITCNFYGNGTAPTPVSGLESSIVAVDCTTLDPQYVNAASGNYSLGNATLIGGGYPGGVLPGSATPSFSNVGASQQDPSAGGFLPTFRRRSSPQLRM